MSKQKVAVVMGGPSREHEVSLNTGTAMVKNIDSSKYDALQIVVSKTHEWFFGEEESSLNTGKALQRLADENFTVMIGLHGTYGEDGTLQALLEMYNIPYTGSGLGASILAMDKIASNEVYASHGLNIPKSLSFSDDDQDIESVVNSNFALPVIVKPARQGSSVGVSLVEEESQLKEAIKTAFLYDQQILVQDYIVGRELSCGVLERDGTLTALPPTELIPRGSSFFDFKAKYDPNGAEEITPPANMSEELIASVKTIAILAHNALGCRTYSRTDMIVQDNDVYLIETNTLPGMTATSILPQEAEKSGITFSELLTYIIQGARI